MADPDGIMEREELLPLIISQLHQYGLHEHARRLGLDTRIPLSQSTASSRLAELAFLGKQAELLDESGDEFGGESAFDGLADGDGLSFDDSDLSSEFTAGFFHEACIQLYTYAPPLSKSLLVGRSTTSSKLRRSLCVHAQSAGSVRGIFF